MLLDNKSLKTESTYYGKKVFYLDKTLAQRLEPEQIRMIFKPENIEEKKPDTLH